MKLLAYAAVVPLLVVVAWGLSFRWIDSDNPYVFCAGNFGAVVGITVLVVALLGAAVWGTHQLGLF